jgi:hypothetical protein
MLNPEPNKRRQSAIVFGYGTFNLQFFYPSPLEQQGVQK